MKLNPTYVRNARRGAQVCAAVVLLIGGIVVLGWVLHLEALKSIITGRATMKANTAIAFTFSGAALWLGARAKPTQIQIFGMRICASVVALLGLLSLGEYITGMNFGFDQFIFMDPQTALTAFPGRMSPSAALNFSLTGAGLLFMHSRWKHSVRLTQALTLPAYGIAAIALVGYIYDVQALYRIGPFSSMALNTAISFFLLANGILFAQPDQGMMSLLLSNSLGSRTLRRFLPVIVGVPIGLGLLVLFGEERALYRFEFGLACMVILNISFISIALWIGSRWMNGLDEERRQMDDALRESEEKYHAFFENSLDAILLTSPDGSVLAANPAACTMFGRTEAEIRALGRGGLVDASDPRLENLLAERASTGKVHGELTMLRKDGVPFPVEMSSALFQDRQGNTRTSIIARDITQRKQAEMELRSSEAKFATFFEKAPFAVTLSTVSDGVITDVNESFERLFGYTKEEAQGRTAQELGMNPDLETRTRTIAAIAEQGFVRDLETTVRVKSGEVRFMSFNLDIVHVGDQQYLLTMIQDITERKQAESALRESEQLFSKIFTDSPVAISLVALPAGKNIQINDAWCALTGYSRAEAIGYNTAELKIFDEEERKKLVTAFSDQGYSKLVESVITTKKGERKNILVSSDLVTINEGERIITSVIDITERKLAEESLRLYEERFANAFHTSPAGLTITRIADGKFVEANEAFCKMLEFSREEVIGHTSTELNMWTPDERKRLIEEQVRSGGLYNFELRVQAKSGRSVYMLFSSKSMDLEGGAHHITTMIDITERKQAEEQVRYQAGLLENVNDAIVAADANYLIKAWNPAAEKMYGWSAEEVIGQNGANILQTQFNGADAEEMRRQIVEAGHYFGEATQLRRDGSRIPVEIASIVLRDNAGQITDYVSVIRDISARKQAEEKIQRQNQRLSVLREIDTAILAADSVESIVGVALSHIRELIECRRTSLALIDWGINEALLFDVRTENETAVSKGTRVSFSAYQDMIPILAQNQPVLTNDLTAVPNPPPQLQMGIKEGLRSVCILPLFAQGNLIGMFNMSSEIPGYFDDEKINLGREVANQVALAITQKNLLEDLHDQQARTSGIINSAMDAIISIDVDQHIVLFNPAAEVMFQYEQADVVGQPIERLLPERFRGRHSKHIQQFAEKGVTSRAMGALGTIYGLRRNGEEFPIEASISQTLVAGKSLFTVILRDVTARQQAESALRQSQENFAKAFNANPAAIAITRLVDGKFIDLNPAYLRIMEYERHELLGYTAAEKSIYASPEERAPLIQQLQAEGSVQNYELRVRVKSGGIRNIILSMQPILYNEEECILTVFIDISERKNMEAELQRSNTELEQFAYVASHDLQEPLRAVAGMVQLLGQRYKGKLDERADEYIGHAVEASGRMQNLINDLLDYSRVDRLGKPLSPTDLERTLDIGLANLQVAIHESGARITREPLPTVTVDASQLTQVFQNLIGNAIKFRGERAPQIHVGAEQVENGWRISVRDNGIGIAPEYFERIFLVFQRLHTRREYSGTGIGLALCKKIIERHKGQIWVESQPEQGSTFYFTIPQR